MIYFDNAATSFPKAPTVTAAMTKFIAEDAANPGRAGHRMAVRAEEMVDNVRLKLSRLFNAQAHERMIFTLNGTDALNMGIKGLLGGKRSSDPVPHVITTVLEHNSVSRPLQSMADAGVIELTRVECDDEGFVTVDAVEAAIRPNTTLVVMTHCSNVLGTIQDITAIGKLVRNRDLLFFVDAAQTAGVVPIDIQAMNIDLLAFPGHKSLLGPTGTGALYVGSRCPLPQLDQFNPWREGGTGGDSATPTQPPIWPYYLEGGTPNTVGIAGLSAGIDYVLEKGMDSIREHEQQMVQKIIDRFAKDERFTIYGSLDATRRVGTLCLNIKGYEPADVGTILDDSFDIAVRPGLHCAPYAHKQVGTFPAGSVRISPGAFNTNEELDQLLDALDQIAG
ncbi:MAG TPA: cysteine desulfurase [Phycisphaerales bacterium]|nr:cysteine desulfurase [Phycisphaerales bacterium]|tara:strand:+ start:32126 stop:33301 length:1176 start_codon:yes stop_codon:yes gene_type:complete